MRLVVGDGCRTGKCGWLGGERWAVCGHALAGTRAGIAAAYHCLANAHYSTGEDDQRVVALSAMKYCILLLIF